MNEAPHIVRFHLDSQHFALRLSKVERVIRGVEVTPLPEGPAIVTGVINMQGRIIPVVDIRQRFGLPAREMELSDQFIIARATHRTVGLWVDGVTGTLALREQDVTATGHIAPTPYVEGVVKLEDGLVLIHDLDTFLSIDEAAALESALQEAGGGK